MGFAGRCVYGPKFLVRHDVILVTLNYRVGPYGFMCPGTKRVPENQGIKDQLLALEWVRDNIQAFGGDVENINVFGRSAGAMSIEIHGIFEAIDDTAVCPQRNEFNNELAGILDCLHVNVYVPDTITDKNLPVLVWIYGRAFTIGFAGRYVYGPKCLVRHDVILVTLSYRVGPYGFLCPGTERVPGNQGIKDQLLALEWVKVNIQAFGGDVENINVFRQSAGAMSIEIQLLSTQEKLFKRAILHSGFVARPGI
ncbi:unnamed protein product [Leptidea sinapis]|uniref:Carboxylic ester hydrolase n=1 Tax=Leptidea sinapis TaxID=189913 RepID=A0A5E4PPW7_9NEOP|nr:unnamed protein product [Leptidea sinapis]